MTQLLLPDGSPARTWLWRACLAAGLASLQARAWGQTPTFAAPTINGAGVGSTPRSVRIADVNGDGKPDLLTANYSSATVGVLLGTGTGSFSYPATYSVGAGSFPMEVAVADVNNDGRPDLLTANSLTNSVGVLFGNGQGSFGNLATYSTGAGSSPRSLAVADVNGDGQADVLTANVGTYTVGVLLSSGTGGFSAPAAYSTGANSGPISLAVADVNGDGRPDVLTANNIANAVGVLLNTGPIGFSAGFAPVVAYDAGYGSRPNSIAVADVNGDGRPDVLTANSASHTAGVLLGTGTGSFGSVATYSTGAYSQPMCLAVADVNGDGRPDLVTANQGSNTAGVLLGLGTGSFGAPLAYNAGVVSYAPGIAAADLNGDGRPDIVTANAGNDALGVLLNTTVLATRAPLPGASATLAPNPARASTTLTTTGLPGAARTLDATLHNALGQAVRHFTLPATGTGPAAIGTAGLPAGVYLLRLSARDAHGMVLGTLPTQRLQVE